MKRFTYFVLGIVVWILFTWPFSKGGVDIQILVAGLIAAAAVSLLFHRVLSKEYRVFLLPIRLFWIIVYLPVLFYYIVKANLDVVYRALHPKMPIHPGIVKIKTRLTTDSGITALANSITLTPGTLTVDVGKDGILYVHWINVKATDITETTRRIGQRFEWFLEKVFE